MKKFALICMLAIALLPLKSEAFILDSVFKTTPKTTTTQNISALDLAQTLANLNSQAQAVDTSAQKSFLSIVSKLSTPQESQTLSSKLNNILSNTSKTEVEKSELISELMSNYALNLKNNKNDFASIIKNLSTSEQNSLNNDITDLIQDSQQYLNLATQGMTTASNLLKTASKIEDITSNISTIKQTTTLYKNRAKTIITLTNQLKTVTKYAGLLSL